MLGLSLGHVELPGCPEVKVEILAIFSAPILKRFVRQLFLRTTKDTDFGWSAPMIVVVKVTAWA
jgi:hypothetical protein